MEWKFKTLATLNDQIYFKIEREREREIDIYIFFIKNLK